VPGEFTLCLKKSASKGGSVIAILAGKQSSLQTRIATTQSISLYVLMKS